LSYEANLETYSDAEIVAYYEAQEGLLPCEQEIFRRFLEPGGAILDLGVGGGRTSPFLSARARRYVGADYAAAMVEASRRRFPQLEFLTLDACDLSVFEKDAFDTVVFSFNGLGSIGRDADRERCLREVARVLRPKGRFIFSLHNANCLAVPPQWPAAVSVESAYRFARALARALWMSANTLLHPPFYRGSGYLREPTHGGLTQYQATPQTTIREVEAAGFRVLDLVSGAFPDDRSKYLTGWYYYACEKL
jgi:SAM-dependent methyltransferase